MATSTSASTPNISGRRGARDRNKGRFLLYFRLFLATLFIIVVSLYIAMSSALLEHQNRHQLAVDLAHQQQERLAAAIQNKPIVEKAIRLSDLQKQDIEEVEEDVGDDKITKEGDTGELDQREAPDQLHQLAIEEDEDKEDEDEDKEDLAGNQENPGQPRRYQYWRKLAVDLAKFQPAELLEKLEKEDPFGVRAFENKLMQAESDKEKFLTLSEVKQIFPCPADRITLPDQRDNNKAKAFRDGENFLFFQHLRKAGGTNFCALAEHNFPKRNLPSYYCMPDYEWGQKNCAGCLYQFSNKEITSQIGDYRIAGNEWDSFDHRRFFDLPAVFTTSFRKPLDRALSQFRFECVEDRGCSEKDVGKWWKKESRLVNVYAWTFADPDTFGLRKIYQGKKEEDANKRGQIMGKALDVVIRFNLVLSMEWLAYAENPVKSVLGFHNTETLTSRVRPHATGKFKRDDGQQHNDMGAAGIKKASWDPKEYLTPEQYKQMSEELAVDEVLTDAARRIFLERLVCDDV